MNPIRLVSCLLTYPHCLAQQNRFVSSWQSGQTPAAVSIWCVMLQWAKPVWHILLYMCRPSQQRSQAETSRWNWAEIKCNKYWNNNNELQYQIKYFCTLYLRTNLVMNRPINHTPTFNNCGSKTFSATQSEQTCRIKRRRNMLGDTSRQMFEFSIVVGILLRYRLETQK